MSLARNDDYDEDDVGQEPLGPPPRVYEVPTEAECALYAILTDHSGIDLAEFMFVDETAEDNCWRAWPFQVSWWRSHARKQVDLCVAEGQLVLTDKGNVPIEVVRVGDRVLTHRGRWRTVTATWCRGEKEVVSVRGQGHPGLLVTPDHELWARRSRQTEDVDKGELLEPEWLAPANWEWNDGSGTMAANWSSPAHLVDQSQPGVQVLDDGLVWSPVTSITPAGTAVVYDLQVQEDHSFVVEGVVVSNCGRSVGKALDLTTPIPTPTGWTTMGDLRVGDVVFDETGAPTRVTDAHDVQLDRDCFEVTFDDGNQIVADGDHRWSIWERPPNRRTGVNATRAVVPTTELRTSGTGISRIPVAGALRTRQADVPLPPYVLGYWLGDGATAHGGLTVGAHDVDEVVELLGEEGVVARPGRHKFVGLHWPREWSELPVLTDDAPPSNSRLTDEDVREMRRRARAGERGSTLAISYGISQGNAAAILAGQSRPTAGGPIRKPEVPLGRTLHQLGVIGNKHVPDEYMRGSFDQRLALLQGLMDSDGHCTKQSGRCEITLTLERLARQVYELVASLGLKPFFEKRRATLNGVDCGPAYRVGFAPLQVVPFRLERKKAALRFPSALTTARVSERRVVSVRPVPTRPVRCISVESPTSTFLAGAGMIPTHNSESLLARACSFAFRMPGQEMVITAPEGIHVDAITDRIEARLTGVRFLREMLWGGRLSIKHKPFNCRFSNGARIIGRIPQRTGVGLKGSHPVCLELDEAQDFPTRAWREIFATLNRAVDGSEWRVHGVTKGVRDEFYEITQDRSSKGLDDDVEAAKADWQIHRYTAIHRPTWTAQERADAIAEYGSTEDPDYKRNILGTHGDQANSLWVFSRFMAASDSDETSEYNTDEYTRIRITAEMVEDRVGSVGHEIATSSAEHTDAIVSFLEEIPTSHRRYKTIWMGMDVGRTNDPSEILVFAEYQPTAEEKRRDQRLKQAVPRENTSRFKLLTRVSLIRIPTPLQADVIMKLIDFYRPRAFALDATGIGFPVFDQLQKRAHLSHTIVFEDTDKMTEEQRVVVEEQKAAAREALTIIKGYNFSAKIIIGIDEQKAAELGTNPTPAELAEKAAIRQNVRDYATDCLRELVDDYRLKLPWDGDLLKQWNGQTWSYSSSPIDAYGNRVRAYSKGVFHTLDGGRMAILSAFQEPIEALLSRPAARRAPVFAQFVD